MKRLYTSFLLLVFLAACAVMPKDVPDRLLVGYATVTQVAEATTSLLKQKQISVATAKRVHQAVSFALIALDRSRDLHYSGKSKEAAAQLDEASKAIREAQAVLKGGK
jgi:hypothetical protein